jgi:hypothetical protein
MIRFIIFSVLCASPWLAKAQTVSGCDNLAGGTINFRVQWPEVWTALNEMSSCTDNCHIGSEPSGNLDLSSVRFSQLYLVEQFAQQGTVKLVDPGFPERSLLFNKVNCASPGFGGRMPPGGHMPAALQALIFDWIEQGGYGESEKDPIQREFVFRDGGESLRRPRRS